MAYISSNVKEDAQDDTLRFLAILVWNAAEAIRKRDPARLYTECNIAYMTFKARLSDEQRETQEQHRAQAKQMLFGLGRERSTIAGSALLDLCMSWYEELCDALTKKGILLRLEANLDELTAGRVG